MWLVVASYLSCASVDIHGRQLSHESTNELRLERTSSSKFGDDLRPEKRDAKDDASCPWSYRTYTVVIVGLCKKYAGSWIRGQLAL